MDGRFKLQLTRRSSDIRFRKNFLTERPQAREERLSGNGRDPRGLGDGGDGQETSLFEEAKGRRARSRELLGCRGRLSRYGAHPRIEEAGHDLQGIAIRVAVSGGREENGDAGLGQGQFLDDLLETREPLLKLGFRREHLVRLEGAEKLPDAGQGPAGGCPPPRSRPCCWVHTGSNRRLPPRSAQG